VKGKSCTQKQKIKATRFTLQAKEKCKKLPYLGRRHPIQYRSQNAAKFRMLPATLIGQGGVELML
jgi:hypothetical protein